MKKKILVHYELLQDLYLVQEAAWTMECLVQLGWAI